MSEADWLACTMMGQGEVQYAYTSNVALSETQFNVMGLTKVMRCQYCARSTGTLIGVCQGCGAPL